MSISKPLTLRRLLGNLDMNGNNIQDVTPTEMAYVSGVTSAIQTQLNGKAATSHTHNSLEINPYTSSSDPTANDDSVNTSTNGAFAVGDFWLNSNNDKLWLCQDATATAAIWTEVVVANASGEITGQLIQLNDTAASLAAVVPAEGQLAYATDTGKIVMGDGATTFASLGAINVILQGGDETYDVRTLLSNNSVTPNARGEGSVDLQLRRFQATEVPSGENSALVGGAGNTASGIRSGAFVGGSNAATGQNSACVGGNGNSVSTPDATTLGGVNNTNGGVRGALIGGTACEISAGNDGAIVGGTSNTLSGTAGVIIGGLSSTVSASNAVSIGCSFTTVSGANAVAVGGGAFFAGHMVSGDYAAVVGGASNTASGDYSFAAGRRAKSTAQGAYTLADSTNADFTNATVNQFAARFSGGFLFQGATRSGTTTLSAVGPTDNLDVTQVNTVFINAASNAVTIGGLVGGKAGQELRLVITGINAANAVTIEHNEGTANQNIFLSTGADEARTNQYGGWLLVCDGTNWYAGTH